MYKGFYFDCNLFDESDRSNLIDRINDLKSDDNKITELSEYFYFEYENGNLVDYQEVKFDEEGLNNLYANN